MSIFEKTRVVPRTALSTALRAARLPLTTYETVLRRGRDNATWRPAVAFESLEGSVQHAAGTLLRDEELIERGALTRAKVAQLRKAAGLEDLAEQERTAAKAELAERKKKTSKQRASARKTAEQREERLDKEREQRVQAARQQAAERKAQVREAEDVIEDVLDKTERVGRLAALDAEAEALEAERQAVARQGEVIDLDETIEEVHELRTGGT